MKNIQPENINPTKGRLLVKIYEGEQETSSGLEIVSSGANTAPVLGTLLKVGKDSLFKEGDIVFFRRYATDELRIPQGETEQIFYFIDESDVLGVLVDDFKNNKRSGNYTQIEQRVSIKKDATEKTKGSQEASQKGNGKRQASKKRL